jgi:putative aldouronate transport system permease protein
MLDGANDLVIFFKIILPLCMPILATVTLFLAVGQWNSWFDTFLYNSEVPSLTTLQFELRKIMQSVEATSGSAGGTNPEALKRLAQNQAVSPESTKMAVTIIATVPILLVYPFVQKYFVQGMTLGAVKS